MDALYANSVQVHVTGALDVCTTRLHTGLGTMRRPPYGASIKVG